MSETGATDPQYVAEFVDGPMAGMAERRYMVGGKVEDRINAVALVDGIEALLWYVAGEERTVAGVKHVSFAFDAPDSDSVESDPEQESLYGYGPGI